MSDKNYYSDIIISPYLHPPKMIYIAIMTPDKYLNNIYTVSL